MKIFTVLGTLVEEDENKRAKYTYDEKLNKKLDKKFALKKENYTNMFPLLIDNFTSKNVCSIYTDFAKERQEKTLANEFGENFVYHFDENYHIKDEKDFNETFKILSQAIDMADDEEIILDLTHSFRHIPILATVALISKNLQGGKKIKHIFFAKEVIFQKEYEIIDLKEYLEIANLSIMLENFSQNYTLTSNTEFENEEYQELIKSLQDVSNAILANSIKLLYDDNLLQKTKNSLEKISKSEIFVGYKTSIDKTIEHIEELLKLKELQDYERLFEMSKLMNKKGYLLNAITLLYEALAFYCVDGIKNISPNIQKSFEKYLNDTKSETKNYNLSKFSLNFVERNVIKRSWKENKILNDKYDKEIIDFLKNIEKIKELQAFIKEIKDFRNNLTHANSGIIIDNAKIELRGLHEKFKDICIQKDILQAQKE